MAKALNADMILVANGGLGSAYDELELNRGICEKYGIKVRGVVLNKVRAFEVRSACCCSCTIDIANSALTVLLLIMHQL